MSTYPADVKRLLRQTNDTFNVLYYSDEYTTPRENGALKAAVVFCTALTIYVAKKKDFKVYYQVALKSVENVAIKSRSLHVSFTESGVPTTVELVADSAAMTAFEKAVRGAMAADLKQKPGVVASAKSRGGARVSFVTSLQPSAVSATMKGVSASPAKNPTTPKQNLMGANRLLIVKSMVDSDFRDCSALRAAYMRGTESELQSDVKLYMSENRKEMYAMCVHEHERFLNAIESSGTIEGEALDNVAEQSSAVTDVVASVLSAVQEQKALVVDSANALRNLSRAHRELLDVAGVLQMVHVATACLESGNYYTAIGTLQKLISSNRELALPHKVVRTVVTTHIPALRDALYTKLKNDTNAWLTALRDQSEDIGKRLIEQFGCKRRDRVKRVVVVLGETWLVQEVDEPAEIVNTFLMTEVLPVSQGMVLQRTYKLMGHEEFFGPYVVDGRRKQFSFELGSMHPHDFPKNYDTWFKKLSGIVITEDVLANSFDPPLCSAVEIHTIWETVCSHIMPCFRVILSQPGVTQEEYTKLLDSGLRFLGTLVECVRSAQLNYIPLRDKLDEVRDRVVDMIAAEYNARMIAATAKESFQPVSVKTQKEYDANVASIFLQNHSLYKFGVFKNGCELRLPFTPMVPAVGQIIAEFLTRIGELCQYTSTPDARIVSQVAAMLAPIPEGLKKRAAGLGLTHSLQLAMLVVNASYFGFLTNVIEAVLSVVATEHTYGANRFHEPGPWLRDTFHEFTAAGRHLEKFFFSFFLSRVDDLFAIINPATSWTPHNKSVDTVNHLSDIVMFMETMFSKIEVMLAAPAFAAKCRGESLTYVVEKLSKITHQIGLTATNGEATEAVLRLLEKDAVVLVEYAEGAGHGVDAFRTSLAAMHNHCAQLIQKEERRKDKERQAELANGKRLQDIKGVFSVLNPLKIWKEQTAGNPIFGSGKPPSRGLTPPQSPAAVTPKEDKPQGRPTPGQNLAADPRPKAPT